MLQIIQRKPGQPVMVAEGERMIMKAVVKLLTHVMDIYGIMQKGQVFLTVVMEHSLQRMVQQLNHS